MPTLNEDLLILGIQSVERPQEAYQAVLLAILVLNFAIVRQNDGHSKLAFRRYTLLAFPLEAVFRGIILVV